MKHGLSPLYKEKTYSIKGDNQYETWITSLI
jgi:hypothetical protein